MFSFLLAIGLSGWVLLDAWHPAERGGSGRRFDWGLIEKLSDRSRIVLAGGLTPRPMSDEPDALLRAIVAMFRAIGIPHMVVGSFASTFHGEPRTTRDLDLVVEVGLFFRLQLLQLRVKRLDPGRIDRDESGPELDQQLAERIADDGRLAFALLLAILGLRPEERQSRAVRMLGPVGKIGIRAANQIHRPERVDLHAEVVRVLRRRQDAG